MDVPTGITVGFGVMLGAIGMAYQLTHVDPLTLWVVEGALIAIPAGMIIALGVYLSRLDVPHRWRIAGLALLGSVVAAGFVIGYLFTEALNGASVHEAGRLLIHGALAGSLVVLLVAMVVPFERANPARVDESSPDPHAEFVPEDERVIRLLAAAGGYLWQSDIVTEFDWSAAKTSRLLSAMEDDGRVTRYQLGRRKVVCLPHREPEPFETRDPAYA